jgi:hypothetical protein
MAAEKDRNGYGKNSLRFKLIGGISKKWAILTQASKATRSRGRSNDLTGVGFWLNYQMLKIKSTPL